MSDPYKRVILVTGANTGIGYGLVQLLAAKGHRVYLAARNPALGHAAQAKLKAEDGLDVEFVQLDVTSPASVAAACAVVDQADGHLDTLINNAGVGLMHDSTGALTEAVENLRLAMDVNFFGVVHVSQAFAPLLKKSPPGHACVVNVTIPCGSPAWLATDAGRPFKSWIAYNTSKAAANAYTVMLARELEGAVKVNAFSPGVTSTNLNGYHPGMTWKEAAEPIVPWALLGPGPEDADKTCIHWASFPKDGLAQW